MEINNTEVLVANNFLEDPQIGIGINPKGEFIASFDNKNFQLVDNNNLVYLFRLLEIEYSFFYETLQNMVSEFNSLTKSNKGNLLKFPFVEMVKAALTSDRDYWVELSIPWVIAIDKNLFKDLILELSKNKQLSQKLRHRLLKL